MYKTLNEMLEVSQSYDRTKTDFTFPKDKVFFDEECRIVVPQGGWDELLNGDEAGETRLPLTDWALGQVCNKLGPPPVPYMRDCPPDLRAWNLEHWRMNPTKDGRPWFIRSNDGECRAVLSDAYTPIPNSRYLQSLIDVVGDIPYELYRPYVDADRMLVRLGVRSNNLDHLGPDEGRGAGNYGVGFQGGNGETGGHKLTLRGGILRGSCLNSLWFDDDKLEITHIHHSPSFVFGAIKEWAGRALRLATERIDEIVKAEAENIPAFGDVVRKLGENNKWNDSIHDLIMIGSEGNQSRMGLVNGISYAGAYLEDADPEDSLALELFAGAVLMNEKNFVSVLARDVVRNQ